MSLDSAFTHLVHERFGLGCEFTLGANAGAVLVEEEGKWCAC